MSFSSVCWKCSALRFSWEAIWESWREREDCRDVWAGFDGVEVGGLRGMRASVFVGARAVVVDGDVRARGGKEGGRGDGGREGGEKRAVEERSGVFCSGGENSGFGMDGRSGAGRLVGGSVR